MDEAAARLVDARAKLEHAGEHVPALEAECLCAQARALRAAGQPAQAERLCKQAVELLVEHGDDMPGELAEAHIDLACAAADLARPEDAADLFDDALPGVEAIVDVRKKRAVQMRGVMLVTTLLEDCGYVSSAARQLELAVQWQREHEAESLEANLPERARALLRLAKVQLRMEKYDEAVELLDEAGVVLSAVPGYHPDQVELAIVRTAVDEVDAALEKLSEVEALLLERYDDDLHPSVLRVLPVLLQPERVALHCDAGEAMVRAGEISFEEGMALLVHAVKPFKELGRPGDQPRCNDIATLCGVAWRPRWSLMLSGGENQQRRAWSARPS